VPSVREQVLQRFGVNNPAREPDQQIGDALYDLLYTVDLNGLCVDGWMYVHVRSESPDLLLAVGLMTLLPTGSLPMEVKIQRLDDALSWDVQVGRPDTAWLASSDSKQWKSVYLYATGERDSPQWEWDRRFHGVIRRADSILFRPYSSDDRGTCLDLFDSNCPDFFAPNERVEYAHFLDTDPKGYELCLLNGQVGGAFGLCGDGGARRRLNWIMLNPRFQGLGAGRAIMARVAAQAMSAGIEVIDIAASHVSAPFFAKAGAVAKREIPNGWGPGMHRVDMELLLGPVSDGKGQ
jgi:GNAT superfamily N-acetyltransferase